MPGMFQEQRGSQYGWSRGRKKGSERGGQGRGRARSHMTPGRGEDSDFHSERGRELTENDVTCLTRGSFSILFCLNLFI